MASLNEPSLDEILAFCAQDPVERVFLEDVARRGLGGFTGLESAGRLQALCHVGPNVAPSGNGCAAFAEVAAAGHARMAIGDERAVTELWDEAKDRLPEPREDRPGPPVDVIDSARPPGDTGRPRPPGGPGLRADTEEDLELLVPACAAAHFEEIGIDPLARDPESFRWRTRMQIEDARSWLWRENGTILFKSEASAWTPRAVQLQQVWVDPSVRSRGYAQRAMRDLCRLLLERVPLVCLFVRAENAPAIRVYEAIGMEQVGTYRSLIF